MNLATLAARNLRRRPARTGLLVFSISIAVATALSLLALSSGIETASHEGAQERGADLTVAQSDASDVFSGFIAEEYGPKIAAMPGVRGISGELVMFAPVNGDQQLLTFALADESYFWGEMPVKEGRKPQKGERWALMLGENVARTLGRGVGQSITMFDQEMKVVGITGYRAAVNRSIIISRLADLQELSFRTDAVTVFQIALQPSLSLTEAEALSREIEKLGRVTVSPTDTLFARDRNVAVLRAISRVTSIIALTMAGLSVLNVLLMAVQERVRETGILMAIGWSDGRIITTIILEGLITGLLGCIVGIPLGYLACAYFQYLPTVGAYLQISPSGQSIVLAIIGALALSAIGSLYPAWRAVSHTPAEALRRA